MDMGEVMDTKETVGEWALKVAQRLIDELDKCKAAQPAARPALHFYKRRVVAEVMYGAK
jgi:hypothetical protein